MIKAILSVCAQSIVRDETSKNTSILNIIEGISGVGFPLFVQELYYFAILTRESDDPARLDCTLRCSMNGSEVYNWPVTANFQDKFKTRLTIRIQGFAVPSPGKMTFTLMYGDDAMASFQIEFVKMGSPDVQNIQPPPADQPATPVP